MDHLISMYIDNELSLEEKIHFLEHVHAHREYKDEAVSLLEQEKLLGTALRHPAPDIPLPDTRPSIFRLPPFRAMGWAAAACLLLLFSFTAGLHFSPQQHIADTEPAIAGYRFVIHQQGTNQVEITGSFTNWQRVPLVPTGTSGYWEITLEVPPGEHRYAFIVDGDKLLPDPTVIAAETDDFGAANSILKVEA
jgi:hypothetical protein